MIDPSDFAILLITLVACVYCFLLSRRLKSLQDTKNGLGATILALSDSVTSVSETADESRGQAEQLAFQLSALMTQAADMCQRIEIAMAELDHKHAKATEKANTVYSEFDELMRDLLNQARHQIADMNSVTQEMKHVALGSVSHIDEAIQRAEGST